MLSNKRRKKNLRLLDCADQIDKINDSSDCRHTNHHYAIDKSHEN